MMLKQLDSHMQKKKKKEINQHTTSPFMNINSDWIKNLNVNAKL